MATHFSSINTGNVFLTTSMFIPTVYTLAHMFTELQQINEQPKKAGAARVAK